MFWAWLQTVCINEGVYVAPSAPCTPVCVSVAYTPFSPSPCLPRARFTVDATGMVLGTH